MNTMIELLRSSRSGTQEYRLQDPDKFDGTKSACRGFVNQCRLIFRMQPHRFSNDAVKVGYIISLLKGQALKWASPLLERNNPMLDDLQAFLVEFEQVFDDKDRRVAAEARLQALRQGSKTVAEYASLFQQHAIDVAWNEPAMMYCFRCGLSEEIKDELARIPRPTSLLQLIDVAVQLDERLTERKVERRYGHLPMYGGAAPADATATRRAPPEVTPENEDLGPGPMRIDATRNTLTPGEREERRRKGLCYNCGQKGHLSANCSIKKQKEVGKSRVQSQ